MSNIKVLRLKDGSDIVGDIGDVCDSDDNDVYMIKHPLRALISQEGVRFMPYCPIAEDTEVPIPKDSVEFILKPKEPIRQEWDQAFGSGLVTPNKPSLVLP
jgi:hypothetical protein